MKDTYTDDELIMFEKLVDDLIVGIFDRTDKRYWIKRIIMKSFEEGYETGKKVKK